ncbi:hypothetical protein CRYUN_Cryun02cG0217600 [Craigia yunnanensis]
MAYRRKQQQQGILASAAADDLVDVEVDAAKAIRASSAHKDSSLSSAYGYGSLHSSSSSASPLSTPTPTPKDFHAHEYASMKSLNESKQGFWGSLARKAKSFLDDDNVQQQFESDRRPKSKLPQRPTPEKEGLTIVENRTAGIIQETRKHIRKNPSGSAAQNQPAKQSQMQQQVRTSVQADQEIQLKASRDVAMAMAAKAKLLLRELKTVKADLAFAKERCAQLEEENRILRENRERGDNPEDDELIRLQLETLLAEKARLAHENSIYARENRFLREVVEYHQLTMQDVVYLDESTEEVTEVYPIKVPLLPNMKSMPATSGALPSEASLDTSLQITWNISVHPVPPPEFAEGSQSSAWPSSQA